jgi:hypothetical protein
MNQRNEETRSARSGVRERQRDEGSSWALTKRHRETDRSDVESTSLERLLHFSL